MTFSSKRPTWRHNDESALVIMILSDSISSGTQFVIEHAWFLRRRLHKIFFSFLLKLKKRTSNLHIPGQDYNLYFIFALFKFYSLRFYLFLNEMAAERILTEAASVSFTACRTAAIRFSAHPTRVSVASRSACGSEKLEGRHSDLLINLWATQMRKGPLTLCKIYSQFTFQSSSSSI